MTIPQLISYSTVKVFPLRSGRKQGCHSYHFTQHSTGSPSHSNQTRKKESKQERKNQNCPYLWMILYIKISKHIAKYYQNSSMNSIKLQYFKFKHTKICQISIHKASVIKSMVLAHRQMHRSQEQKKCPRNSEHLHELIATAALFTTGNIWKQQVFINR